MEIVLLIISSALALIGAGLNTETDEKGEKKSVFKIPTHVGWIVIFLIAVSAVLQFFVHKREQDQKQADANAMRQRVFADSVKAYYDSINHVKEVKLLQESYNNQLSVLTNTNSLIGKSKEMSESMEKNFSKSYENFQAVIKQSKSLLNPILPLVTRFRLKIPFNNQWLGKYTKRILSIRDSIVRKKSVLDFPGLDRISLNTEKYYNGFDINKDTILYSFVTDSTSEFYINEKDDVAMRFLNPGFYIYFFPTKPPSYYHETPSDLMLEATKSMGYPGPASPFGGENMYVDFIGRFIILDVYYKIEIFPSKAKIFGIDDIEGKYMLISTQLPISDFEMLSVQLFNGPNFMNKTNIELTPKDNATEPDRGFHYVHRITKKDLQE